MKATLGRMVLYRLSEEDLKDPVFHPTAPGNKYHPGEEVPAEVVRAWPDSSHVNLKLNLDGPNQLWLTSREEGTGEGTWHWPVIAKPAVQVPADAQAPASVPVVGSGG